MNKSILTLLTIGPALLALSTGRAQEIKIENTIDIIGRTKPIAIAMSGFAGEGADVLKFDLTVQGFCFTNANDAQYLISGSDSGSVAGTLTDKIARKTILSQTYSGASLRRQAHALADDIVMAVLNKKGIGQTKIAFKAQPGGFGPGEIYVSDYDGHNPQRITTDNAIVAKPAWVPGKLGIYYTSHLRDNPDIYHHNLQTGQRRAVAAYSGLNTSAAASPDGSKIAMVLSKSGSPNIWVCNADGSNLKHITTGVEDSSPCWSPDGQWICFATKISERRRLAKVSANGGAVQPLSTAGVSNPSEPDWSPDGKWIAFTRQAGDFDICVMPADGSRAPEVLVSGQNPSWSPNSRTLIYNHGSSQQTLSVLDVFTKQYKDCVRATGSSSQPAWAK